MLNFILNLTYKQKNYKVHYNFFLDLNLHPHLVVAELFLLIPDLNCDLTQDFNGGSLEIISSYLSPLRY